MNCFRKVYPNLKNILPFLFLLILIVPVSAQNDVSFDEIYKSQTDFYSSSDYSKIVSRTESVGKSWTVLFYDVGLDSAGGHGDYQLFRQISSNVTNPKLHFIIQSRNARGNIVRYKLNRGAVTSVLERKSFGSIKESLANFLQWGKKTYPADKFLLILRGLGSGIPFGICSDGYSGENLCISDLKQSLADSGVDLDLLIFDTGLSSSLETGVALAPSVSYMLGSQDVLPPNAIDYAGLARNLSSAISTSPSDISKYLIDSYAENVSGQSDSDSFSLSLVDLGKIGDVFVSFARAADEMDLLSESVESLEGFFGAIKNVQNFGHNSPKGFENAFDLADFALWCSDYLKESSTYLLDAIYSAVVYERHGDLLSSASGLSFFYPENVNPGELDSYALNFGCGPYLAFLDAVHDSWSAPEWVRNMFGKKESGKVACLRSFVPEKSRMYPISFSEKSGGKGKSTLEITSGIEAVKSVKSTVYYMEEKSGAIIRISEKSVEADSGNGFYKSEFSGDVLKMDGRQIFVQLMESADGHEIYWSPINLNGVECGMLIRHDLVEDTYSVSGVYSANKGRNRIVLKDGDKLQFLFPAQFGVDVKEKMTVFGSTVYSSMTVIQKEGIKDGYYMTCYSIEDLFGNRYESVGQQMEVIFGQIDDLK